MSLLASTVVDRIKDLPTRSGIYVFRSAEGQPLYIGKAKSLRARCSSYLADRQEPRIAAMLEEARDLEIVLTDSEAEALLLENNWIKRHKPHYNILLRDDKTYPYLKLTLRHEYPRLAFTRRIREDGAAYFGPFLPGGLARKAIQLVQKLFLVRVCSIPIDGKLPRPCLYWDLKRCLGPCVDGLTTPEDYSEAVDNARLFLGGRNDELLKRLRRQMLDSSDELEFEEAARIRDLIRDVKSLGEKRKLSSTQGDDVDVFGVVVVGGKAALSILVMRGGQILDRRDLFWEQEEDLGARSLLSEILPQLYDRTTFVPKEIHLPVEIEGGEALEAWLADRKGEKVYLKVPRRGGKADRVGLAHRNAELAFDRRFRNTAGSAAAAALTRHLDLADLPQHIEGFDISHSQGEATVASLIVWKDGALRRRDYRSFNIRSVDGPDDFASLREAVERRYRRVLEEIGEMPDLIVIDGGKGQLSAALQALALLGVEETPVLGLAKREEEVFLPGRSEPLRIERTDPGLQLLQKIRDETHRFALMKHRQRRRKKVLRSSLDDLAGVGPTRRKALLKHFGSLAAVREAELEELKSFLGPVVGSKVYGQLHKNPDDASG